MSRTARKQSVPLGEVQGQKGLSRRQVIKRGVQVGAGLAMASSAMATFFVPRARAEEVEIDVLGNSGPDKAYRIAVDAFNAQQKGKYRVNLTLIQWTELAGKEYLQFASKRPTYDAVFANGVFIPGMKQYLQPLDDYIAKDGVNVKALHGSLMSDGMYQGHVVALPVRLGIQILFYRKDVLKEAGMTVPTSLQDWVQKARALTLRNNDGTVRRFGSSLKLKDLGTTPITFATFFMPLGGRVLNPDLTRPDESLKSELAADVLRFFKTLTDEHLIPDPLGWGFEQNVVAFQTGKVTFSDEYSPRASQLEDKDASQVIGKMGYDALPKGKLGPYPSAYYVATWYLAIDKNCTPAKKQGAWEFIKLITGAETQREMAYKAENNPTVLDIYGEEKYQAKDPGASAVKRILSTEQLSAIAPVPQMDQIYQAMNEEIQKFILNRQSVKDTQIAMYNRIESVLKK